MIATNSPFGTLKVDPLQNLHHTRPVADRLRQSIHHDHRLRYTAISFTHACDSPHIERHKALITSNQIT